MPKPKKIYAVRKGRTTGILMSWADCLRSVDKFPDAQYKAFPREQIGAANDYLNQRKAEHKPFTLPQTLADGKSVITAWKDLALCPPSSKTNREMNRAIFWAAIAIAFCFGFAASGIITTCFPNCNLCK